MTAKRKPKAAPEKTYTLTLTAEQAQAISHACEMAARIGMSQLDMITWSLPFGAKYTCEVREVLERAERDVKPIIGLPGGGYYGIRHEAVPISAKRAWDIHAVIRHRLSWDRAIAEGTIKEGEPRKWPAMMTVNYDEPDNVAGERLPKMECA